MTNGLTIATVPGFSGAPWKLAQLEALPGCRFRTMRFPDGLQSVNGYADFVAGQVCDLESYVLAGDSFGAIVALALASRQPRGLRALVISGGFAANPTSDPTLRRLYALARCAPGPLYRHIALRIHALVLESPHDDRGEVRWTHLESYRRLAENTPRGAYLSRLKAAFTADYRNRLHRIEVPTLLLTPSYDRLARRRRTSEMLDLIPTVEQIVLPQTGEALRLAHPTQYAMAIQQFLTRHLDLGGANVLPFPTARGRTAEPRPN